MPLNIRTFILGPLQNNTYLVTDKESKETVIIDPSIPSKKISSWMEQNGIELKFILITHAHFDHIGGAQWVRSLSEKHIPIALHEKEADIWNGGGGAKNFGFDFDAGETPDFLVEDQQSLWLGESEIKVLLTPGHSPGHVTYAFIDNLVAFCGDVIFLHSVGRTDLENGSQEDLIASIHQKIFKLPDETILYPGHGEPTSVKEEKKNNPFV